ncbi:MAG: peptidoglycan-binding protein, partial [Fervidobacterium sp.]
MRLKTKWLILLTFMCIFSMLFSLDVTIIHTSNIYGTVFPYNYFTDYYENMGLAVIYNYINSLRKTNSNILVIDTGNMFYGSPYGDFSVENDNEPVAEAFKMIGYDAFVPGTFELNLGKKFLSSIPKKINTPVLASNISDLPNIKSYVIKKLPNGIKVGIIGVTPNVGDFKFRDLISSVKESINEVKKQGVNLIVVAASGGLTKDPISNQTFTMKSNLNIGDVLVKEFSKDVDVFLFGNLPIAYSSQKLNKVYSLLGNSGKSVNKIEITFEKVKNSTKLTNSKIQNVSMKTINPS